MSSEAFPKLNDTNHRITSPETPNYNCIAWAAEDDTKWWWPDPFAFWPFGRPKVATIDNFIQTFTLLGYVRTDNLEEEDGFLKIVLYVKDGVPTHMARQLSGGRWTSKLGQSYDIEHDDPFCIEGPVYGEVHTYFKKPV